MRKSFSRGRLIFTCIWLGVFAVSYIVWAFYLTAVSDRLAEYENTHPEKEAERVFTDYFLNADPMNYSSYDEVESKYDIIGSSKEYYYNLTFGKALAFAEYGKSDGIITYSVTADGCEFARFVLSEGKSGSWQLAKIIITARPEYELYIHAPKSAVVTVNEILLDEKYAVSEYLIADSPVFEGDASKRTMVTYLLKGLYSEPALSVKLDDLNVQLGLEEDESVFSAEDAYVAYLSFLYYGNN